MEEQEDRVYIRQAAEQLDRRMGTLRKWEREDLPIELHPHRGHRNWRYWTPDQIAGIRAWIERTDRRPGKGLPNYFPLEHELDLAIARMRRPKRHCVLCEEAVKSDDEWQERFGKIVHVRCLRDVSQDEESVA